VTCRRSAGRAAVIALLFLAGNGGAPGAPLIDARRSHAPRRIAWHVIDIATGRVLDAQDAELMSRAVLPGSLMKLPALIAWLESGAGRPAARLECPGWVVAGGRRVGCQHPRRTYALGPVEAFASSCNFFFARTGERLSREALNEVLASFGWPKVPPQRALPLAATGIESTAVLPMALLAGFRQLLVDPPGISMHSPTRKIVRDALAAAAAGGGTAAAFKAGGVDALAKTGTGQTSNRQSLGLVLAAWPADRPNRAAIVVVEGGSGPDAAAIGVALARGERPVVTPPPLARAPAGTVPPVSAPASAAAGTAGPPPGVVRGPGSPPPLPLEGSGAMVTIRVGTPRPRGTYDVRALPVEDYVSRVVAGEAAAQTSPSGLEALAIAARTFAFANRRRHARNGFDLCDSTHCQVLREPYPAARAASEDTAGQVLAWQGAPASVFYTASCGGRTERPSAVWPGAADPPYLPSRRDRGCGGEPRWTAAIAEGDVHRALAAAGYRGARLRKLKVRDRTASGRVAMLSLEGMTPGTISGQNFRMAIGRALGWQVVKSTAFGLSHRRGVYTFKGGGYGHGVGFCVIGSMRRAAAGESRTSLLNAYFPGLQVADYRTLRLPAAPLAPPGDPTLPLANDEAGSVVTDGPPRD
jgi:stage II sporulation protein D